VRPYWQYIVKSVQWPFHEENQKQNTPQSALIPSTYFGLENLSTETGVNLISNQVNSYLSQQQHYDMECVPTGSVSIEYFQG
jgi:hypothetical protein